MNKPTDTDSVLMSTGGTVTQLAALFGKSVADTSKALRGKIEPNGFRKGFELFRVRDAAAYLAKLPEDVVSRVLRMNSQELPPNLRKEYWLARNAELDFLERVGDLWKTPEVQELIAECFKSLRLSLLLFSDRVERQKGLTEDQRELIIEMTDAALNEAADRLGNELRGQKTKRNRNARPDYTQGQEEEDLGI